MSQLRLDGRAAEIRGVRPHEPETFNRMRRERNPYLRTESKSRAFFAVVAVGAALGGVVGLLYLWQFTPSLDHFLASLAAGCVAGLVYGVAAVLRWPLTTLQAAGTAAVSGAAGGSAWWVVVRPDLECYWVALIGLVIVVTLYILAELGFNF